MTPRNVTKMVTQFLFLLTGVGIALYLGFMLQHFPLFDFAVNDINWTREWLYMTILDYYGVAICLAFIVIQSEPIPFGFLWSLAFFFLGSPTCCAYIVYRLQFKSVRLLDVDHSKYYQSLE